MPDCTHDWVVQYAEKSIFEFPVSIVDGNLVVKAHSKGPIGTGISHVMVRCVKCDALDYSDLFNKVKEAFDI